jgi:hypothetical protein
MSLLSKVTGGLLGREQPKVPEAAPDLPPPTIAYTLATSADGYVVLDGVVEVGAIVKALGDGDSLTAWKVHVRGVDASFDSLEEAQAWLAPTS